MTSPITPYGSAGDESQLHLDLDVKGYSNICKRMATHLKDQHGVDLSHTQVRTALSEALGFDSPNYLDTLLKEKESKAKQERQSGRRGASPTKESVASKVKGGMADDAQAARVQRQDVMREHLQDLLTKDPDGTLVDLGNLTLSLLAQRHPAKLSVQDKQNIKENYPAVTEDLMAERAMSEEGVIYALAMSIQTSKIALDYFPKSNSAPAREQDAAKGEAAAHVLNPALRAAFEEAVSSGLSPFGTSTLMILMGAILGAQRGVEWSALARTLLETIEQSIKAQPRKPVALPPEFEEETIRHFMSQMGVSRAQAKKYLAMAKDNLSRG